MTRRDLIGLRDSDLHATERADLRQLLADDPEAREEHDFAMGLGDRLGGDEPGGPTLAEVRARAEPTSRRWLWGAGLAVAAAALLVVGMPTESGIRDRGGPAGPSVRLSAVAEGPAGVRPVRSGARIGPDEQVVFWVQASGEGSLTLTEDGSHRVYPTGSGVWSAIPGDQVLGDEQPLAFRPEQVGPHTYTVELCDPSRRCVRHQLALEWATR